MAALDPAIHVFVSPRKKEDVDHRVKPGDDSSYAEIPLLLLRRIIARRLTDLALIVEPEIFADLFSEVVAIQHRNAVGPTKASIRTKCRSGRKVSALLQ
jgi:hypothetical protein